MTSNPSPSPPGLEEHIAESNRAGLQRCLVTARVAAAAVLGLSLLVLSGFAFHLAAFIRLRADLQGMSPVTAVGILSLAVGYLSQSWRKTLAARVAALIAMVIGFGSLVAQAALGLDVLSAAIESAIGFPSSELALVSIATAVCIGLLGWSMLIDARRALGDTLSLCVTVISSYALLGYAYGVQGLYSITVFRTMALHTAAALFVLSLVSMMVRPQSTWCEVIGARTESAEATRRQLALLLVPAAGGWLLLRAVDAQLFNTSVAMALLVLLTAASLGILVMRDGRRLGELEMERRAKIDIQTTLHAEMEARLLAQERELTLHSDQQAMSEAALVKAQRLEALSRLTGGIAHDFNNLLQAISGSMDLLKRRLGEEHPGQALVERVKTATMRGAKLGTQLLAFSRVQQLNIRPVDLDAALLDAEVMLRSALGSKITLRYELQGGDPWINADSDQIELALLNLALNARDAMHDRGEVILSSEVRRLALTEGSPEIDCVTVSLSDTGEGMPPEVVARAMEPFFTTKPAGTASGLGLAQVYGFMRQCGGDVRITSTPQGTRVELLFPRLESPVDTWVGEGGGADITPASGGVALPLILVVEDDRPVREVIVEGLRSSGYEVVQADDGNAGLEFLKTLAPVAAVIDFIMPGLNGAEVAQRARVTRPELPIVFVSGHFETEALAKIENSLILRKPFEMDALRSALRTVLQLAPLPQRLPG